MIRRPEGWTFERRADRVLILPAGGLPAISLRYFESLTPLARVGDLLQQHAKAWRAQQFEVLGKPQPIITNEGEYGAVVQVGAELRGEIWNWSIGFVFFDDSYSCIEGVSSAEDAAFLHATLGQLLTTEERQLGVRLRRFLHRPPAWQGLTIGRSIAHYFHPNYPLIDARLSVFPAVPLRRGMRPIVDFQHMLGEHVLVEVPVPVSGFSALQEPLARPFASTSGLARTWWQCQGTSSGRDVMRDVIVLYDDVYAYAVESAASPTQHVEAIAELVHIARSVQPIPRAGESAVDVSSVSHWAD